MTNATKAMKAINTVCLILVFFSCVAPQKTIAQDAARNLPRTIENINTDWKYLEDNVATVGEALEMKNWQSLNLPHTWNQWDAVDQNPGYRRDASWYTKNINITPAKDRQYLLYFEGSNITTEVYLNRTLVGKHIGGYVGFEMDISPYLSLSGDNELAVRVDNSYDPNIIPSQKADFFIYGGIVRDVWLKTLPIDNIKKVKAATPKVTQNEASTVAIISLNKDCANCSIQAEIVDNASGKVVSQKTVKVSSKEQELVFDNLQAPKLWSPAHPNLYTVHTRLYKNGSLVDELSETIGYRYFEFADHGPFYINGERLLLRGTHRHEEHAGYGAAMPNSLHRQDIELMKGMGVNFLRLGHYPQDPEVYKACNELGIIVWDELPWCRGGLGGSEWKSHTKRLLTEQIEQNYNHPSILFWSLGNEIYWLPDFENGDDREAINPFLTELNNLSHELDPQRLTAIRKYYNGADLVDVFSPSIWSGWYAGVYTNYEKTIIENQKKYRRFLHMEYGGSSHVGRHTETPITGAGTVDADDWEEASNQVNIDNIAQNGDWTENYIVDLFDWHLGVTEQKEDFAGNAQWAFKDFGTPLRPENAIPYINQKGLVDRDGKPKDAYYVFKSYWTEEPMVYIESHTWTNRTGPENKERQLSVYSNCDEVELWVNNTSLGKRTRDITKFPACGLSWSILFAEGTNDIVAIGYKDGKQVSKDELSVNYTYMKAGKPDHIHIYHEFLENGHVMVHAVVRDADKNLVLDYEDRVYFSVDGSGEMMKNYGTPTRSDVIEMANGRASIEMIPGKGKAIIEVRNQSFKGSYHIIDFSNKSGKRTTDDKR